MTEHRNPFPTVDIIIEIGREDGRSGIVLVERKYPPPGWALPGGFVEYGESLEEAAIREAKEETSLDIRIIEQFHTYSEPGRDPRFHTITTVYIATAQGRPRAQDDARNVGIFTEEDMPHPLAFDHERILADYRIKKMSEKDRRNRAPSKDTKLVELTRVMGPVEAEVIKNFLESQGIPCILQGQMVQSVYPMSVDGMGELKVMVSEEDLSVAQELLAGRSQSE